MSSQRSSSLRVLVLLGAAALALALLSVVDMFLPRPYDGVMLEADAPGKLIVRRVVPGSGADRAGIAPGDRIVGIDRELLRSPAHAAGQLNRFRIGEVVPYFVEGAMGLREVRVELGPRRIGDTSYLYACVLGFAFFAVGLFVLLRQPRQRASGVFFLMSSLFMLFLICRLRPASYSWIDTFVLSTGTVALLLLPATFLHFFLIFPEPVWPKVGERFGWSPPRSLLRAGIGALYLVPPLVLLTTLVAERRHLADVSLISGAPAANWWVLAVYLLIGLTLLGMNARSLEEPQRRQGALLVLFGSLFGLLPFVVLAVAFPALLHTEKLVIWGIVPLVLVPLTFAYAIVRFQLLDIRIILRRSLLYTLTTALITGLYAAGIAAFNSLFAGSGETASRYSPLILALAILLLFEPLRRRFQVVSDRFFFAERSRLQRAAREVGEAFVSERDAGEGVRRLVGELPDSLGVRFAALYLSRDGRLRKTVGPEALPSELPSLDVLHRGLRRLGGIGRVERMARVRLRSSDAGALLDRLQRAGVELVGSLGSSRRHLGLLLIAERRGQMPFEDEEIDLLRGLVHQASMALEAQALLEERTRQAELERELDIAATIQASLQPEAVRLAEGWRVAAVCRPARQVGGDFIAELPGPWNGSRAVAYGDVSGKSVSGALVMMAAYEILHSLALTAPHPEELVRLANRRLYEIQRGGFVALGYVTSSPTSEGIVYLLAGQPQPLKRTVDGGILELPLGDHRLPLGAMMAEEYRTLEAEVRPGELVLCYSDGVVEATSPEGEFFGTERLAGVLAEAPADPDEVIGRVLAAVDRFTRGNELYDDMTLVAVARQPEVA
ncbi:MAG: SpoIIE family protein phosphatase [Thermoanaerobaculia bacterium]